MLYYGCANLASNSREYGMQCVKALRKKLNMKSPKEAGHG